jgi:threonyl-tRNA synthetase
MSDQPTARYEDGDLYRIRHVFAAGLEKRLRESGIRAAGAVSLRARDGSRKDGMPVEEFISMVEKRIKERSPQL